MRRIILSAVLLAAAAPAQGQVASPPDTTLRLAGQTPRPTTDSLFRRARRLVAEGNGVAGRALVDSLLRAADPATPAYGDALYWHGALAATAAEAERDYRRVIVEYPLAYYADDALLAIAELEQARGDRAGALAHLQRFVKEHPASPGRGVAALAAARLAFEQHDTKVGCSMITAARTSASSTDVELRNQIEYHGRQCTPASAAGPPPVTPVPATVAAAPVVPRAPAAPAARPQETTAAPRQPATSAVSTMPAPVTPRPRTEPVRRDTPTVATPAPAAGPRAAPRVDMRRGAGMYTIQLAAYETRPPAEALVQKLATRGVHARVSGTARPFRVRLDFYRTRQEAANAAALLKTRGIIGFVTEEVPPAGTRSP